MIRPETIPVWPFGVDMSETEICDSGMHSRHPISGAAFELLKKVDGKKSVERISDEVSAECGWDSREVLGDFMELLASLNQNYLVNIKTPLKPDLIVKDSIIAVLYFFKTLQGVRWEKKKRTHIPAGAPVLKTLLLFLTAVVSVFGHFAAGFGLLVTAASFVLPFLTVYDGAVTAAAFLISFTLHEFGHYAVFQKKTGSLYRIFIAARRGGIQIVRPLADPKTEWLTSLAGPGIPFLTAVLTAAVFVLTPVLPFSTAVLIIAVNLVHLISLLPFAEDGKRMIQAWKTGRKLISVKEEKA
ncbi:hypothetical protein GKZ89_14680 [Bacillus mangrovi]|uniref:PqqD family protein n=1 Tax=Metabacillus mangrovi TaxID=1491830 RepID=A0A7X2S6P5_9BACI|nr:hypothetical protein [Metabacillus mangrovi]MTH54647.1 hypothetical protein [Metabacillus mangrovi]